MHLTAFNLCPGWEQDTHDSEKEKPSTKMSEWKSLKDKSKSDTQTGRERGMTKKSLPLAAINKQANTVIKIMKDCAPSVKE